MECFVQFTFEANNLFNVFHSMLRWCWSTMIFTDNRTLSSSKWTRLHHSSVLFCFFHKAVKFRKTILHKNWIFKNKKLKCLVIGRRNISSHVHSTSMHYILLKFITTKSFEFVSNCPTQTNKCAMFRTSCAPKLYSTHRQTLRWNESIVSGRSHAKFNSIQ